jgi:aldehyde dehydrogenase (NAD+)
MASAAGSMKRLCLELGGKSAAVLLDDIDVPSAAAHAAKAVCVHAGQSCSLATRLLVPRAQYSAAVDAAAAAMDGTPLGDPTDPRTRLGPVINADQRAKVLDYISLGAAEGRLATSNNEVPADRRGFYVRPALIADVDPAARIAQEEVFGPVLVVLPYDDDDDAVRIANLSDYGLGGTVMAADETRALDVARRIRTGTVAINNALWLAPDTPVGGYRRSGFGREHGVEGFEEFLEVKAIGLPAGS